MGDGRRAVEGVVLDPAAWAGRRVLITGHTGFKGGWLALWLAALGAEVTGFAEPAAEPSFFGLAGIDADVRSRIGDVRDAAAVARVVADARPEVVLHLAAQPLVRASYEDPAATYAVNVMGTVNVLDAVRAAAPGVRSVVVVTSDKCYANREWEWGYREDEPLGGRDPYSSSKAAQEIVAAAYRDSYDLPIATARAGNVIGGGDFGADRIVPDAVRAAVAGEPLRVRNPDAIRPWQHVLAPLHGYGLLAERAATGAWNFGPAEADARPVRELVDRLAAAWDGGLTWAADPGDHPHEAHFLKLDSSRARTRLGWAPAWDLEQGVAATAEWYRAWRRGGDVRALALEQIDAYGRGASR
ncbi:MAG: CDP-glucose 4,6-dehydratase [Thermoleophilaceae bacterium]|nr:CDP-glucose 4,6-dehydratase [Thermoleophilaceae bacterium]